MESKCQSDRIVQLNEDQAFWLSLKDDNTMALNKLFNKYHEKLYFYGLKLTGNHNQVLDGIQDLFANIWETRDNLSDVTYVKAYLFSILRYDLLKPKNIIDRPNNEPTLIKDYGFVISPEEIYIDNESQIADVKIIDDLLAGLSSKQREIIYLKFYDNYSNTEISCVLSIKPQSVANLLARTVDRLRKKKNGSRSTIKTSVVAAKIDLLNI